MTSVLGKQLGACCSGDEDHGGDEGYNGNEESTGNVERGGQTMKNLVLMRAEKEEPGGNEEHCG